MKVSFIGCGNMANAMIRGIKNSKLKDQVEITVSNRTRSKIEKLKEEVDINISDSNTNCVENANFVFLCVKPQNYYEVIYEIKDKVQGNVVVITIAPGFKIEEIQKAFSYNVKVVRTMPNTPCLVGAGLTALCFSVEVLESEKEILYKIFKSFGEYIELPENLMDAVPAITGSSPAYTFMYIEALAQGGIKDGIKASDAYKMAAYAVYGAAKMAFETGAHPAVLRDGVCSPAGTTIESVKLLEERGFKGIVMDAMESCTKKTKEMRKE